MPIFCSALTISLFPLISYTELQLRSDIFFLLKNLVNRAFLILWKIHVSFEVFIPAFSA